MRFFLRLGTNYDCIHEALLTLAEISFFCKYNEKITTEIRFLRGLFLHVPGKKRIVE